MEPIPDPSIVLATRKPRWRRALRHFNGLFILTVVLPTLAAGVYYGLIASDVFISESRFVVRSPQRQAQSGLGAILLGNGFSRSQDDTYSVHDFIRSRDALRELDAQRGVRTALSDRKIDFVNRFPGLVEWDPSFEGLYRQYLRHVSIDYDTVSSISVLRVRAYTAAEAKQVNDALLTMGERLVNTLNNRSRQDLISTAQAEVRQAEDSAKAAAMALAEFRANRQVFDPDRQSTLQLSLVTRMQEELIASEAQLSQMRQLSPNNPQIGTMSSRVDALRKSIAAESGKVTGDGSFTSKSPTFDRLVLEKTFADRQLGSALASLETARSDAARKQLYLERLVQPNLPDSAGEPRRARTVFTVFLMGLVAWGIVAFVLASIRDHAD